MTTLLDAAEQSSPPSREARRTGPVLADTRLLADITRFGGGDVSACFSCGTCTAICPLSDNDGTFPRRMIRYGQVGMRDALLSSKELWTCYHCGLCSDSCPQQADPAQYMAAARRYAITGYDRTGLARIMFGRPIVSSALALAVAAFFAAFMYSSHGPRSSQSLNLFRFIPEPLIHWTGVGIMAALCLAALSGLLRMVRGIARREKVTLRSMLGDRRALSRAASACWTTIAVESIGQRRYRQDCNEAQPDPEPLYRRRWLLHALTVWGFLGLLTATILDYLLSVVGFRKIGAPEPIWYPVRLLGTLAGICLVYGVTMFIVNRVGRANRAVVQSASSDWMFLVMLWVVGVTGFLLELALYLPHAPSWGYWVFLFHVSVAMELMLLLPFIKFAHAFYRPVALFFYSLSAQRTTSEGVKP